jgi:hypothetical protein
LLCCQFLFAQKIDCEKITSFLNEKEAQIAHLNLHDPDYIPLHYLLAKEIIKDLDKFKNEVIPHFSNCETIIFNELINKYDELKNNAQQKHNSLVELNKNVYLIFYEKALFEYQFNNETDGNYFLQRSLQYNEIFPNAILLKLNKLLDKNHFGDCLLLLNTLYYETELDHEQEKQAIEFTDKFYDILYKTGDSLVKLEHAAEALELFQILEAFCMNLPTAYCNDDYYHGLLRSKTGIYESYLAIVKAAEERGNLSIAALFRQYAQEYLDANPHLKEYEPKIATSVTNVTDATDAIDATIVHTIPFIPNTIILEENTTPNPSPKELKIQYDKIVLDALALCIKEKFEESYNMFLKAKELEDCHCFKTDYRVDLMLQELYKFIH